MLEIEIRGFAGNAIDPPLHVGSILRMGSLYHQIDGNLGCRFAFKNPECFPGPINLSTGNIPAEAACVAQSLRFGQISLTPAQSLLGAAELSSLFRFA